MAKEEEVEPGGLFRCCIQSLLEERPEAPLAVEGQRTSCRYCHAEVVFRDGAWQWEQGGNLWPARPRSTSK